ncbi:MAG: hypothetical protein GX369_08590 [Euryarchaeota archaeon]|nr:hypothetical protein [Euryarchaeota archaeon]
MDFIEKAVQEQKIFEQLIKLRKDGYVERISDFIDSLDEETSKNIIRRFIYGGWKALARESD